MSSSFDDSLNWLASQYVLGELSESERDAFELRLADDLTACEAVAEATRMNFTLHAALAESASGSSLATNVQVNQIIAPTPRRSWLAVGAAMICVACLFMAVAFWPHESVDPGIASSVPMAASNGSGVEAVELVSLWRSGMQVAEEHLEEADIDTHETASDVAVPGWLLAAVSLEKNGAADGQPEDWQDN